MKYFEVDANNENEAVNLTAIKLHINPNYLKASLITKNQDGSSQFYVEPSHDLSFLGKKYLEEILTALNVEPKIEFRLNKENDELKYRIKSTNNSLLIGRDGRTLQAFLTMLRNFLQNFVISPIKVTLDIGDYNDTRATQLQILATKIAKEVTQTKINAALSPMNSYERRIIHEKLASWHDVTTESIGEGQNRRVVIKFKRHDKSK